MSTQNNTVRDEFGAPPNDLRAELAVLGSMMLDGAPACSEATELLADSDFYRDAHRWIFRAMLDVVARHTPLDIITLRDELVRAGVLDQIGGIEYVTANISGTMFTSKNMAYYAGIVRDLAARRRLMATCRQIYQAAGDLVQTDTAAIFDFAEQAVFDCASTKTGLNDEWRSVADLIPDVFAEIDERHQRGGDLAGLSTGLSVLNDMTQGLQPGVLFTLAARTSMGKTAAAGGMAYTVAEEIRDTNGAVAFFSCEMKSTAIIKRIWAMLSGLTVHRLGSGLWTVDQQRAVIAGQNRLAPLPLYLDDAEDMTVTRLVARARRLHKKKPLRLIVVDYLQRLQGYEGFDYRNDRERVSHNAIGLKNLARSLNVPVLALAQVSREAERQEDKRPNLSHLSDSAQIEKESDIVAFLYRPAYYAAKEQGGNADEVEEAEIIIAKHRDGQTGHVKVQFEPRLMRFSDLPEGGL